VAYELARHLANRGEEVILIADADADVLARSPASLSVVSVGRPGAFDWLVSRLPLEFPRWVLQHLLGNVRAARRARLLLRTSPAGFDAVHSHCALATILVRPVIGAGVGAIPLVYTEHDSTPWSCRYRHWFERLVRRCVYRQVNLRACRAATAVVTNFAALADEIAQRAGIPRSRFVTVPNATAVARQASRAAAASIRARHGMDRYCLFVGALIDRKCPDILLRALTRVSMPCIFVGDGPMRPALERLASESGISDRVIFTGALERREISTYYSGAEALVLPSVSEGVPLVTIEALGAGLPVVASNLGGIASVVRHRRNGLLIRPGDQDALAQALALIEADKSLRAALRHGALASAGVTARTWPEVVNTMSTLYVKSRPVLAVPRPRTKANPLPAGPRLGEAPELAITPSKGSLDA
jgi:glycosyltransferase involved in cell wall biosynthesis